MGSGELSGSSRPKTYGLPQVTSSYATIAATESFEASFRRTLAPSSRARPSRASLTPCVPPPPRARVLVGRSQVPWNTLLPRRRQLVPATHDDFGEGPMNL